MTRRCYVSINRWLPSGQSDGSVVDSADAQEAAAKVAELLSTAPVGTEMSMSLLVTEGEDDGSESEDEEGAGPARA